MDPSRNAQMSKIRTALRNALYCVRERKIVRKKMSSELVTMDMTARVSDGHDRYVVMSVCVMLSVCQWWRNESSLSMVPD